MQFAEVINKCSFLDLGFSGPRFSWTNLQQPNCLIQEHLDRALVNGFWRQLWPNTEEVHLPRVHLDHCPLLLKCQPIHHAFLPRTFSFETTWLSHADLKNLDKDTWLEEEGKLGPTISRFSEKAIIWNKNYL